ncbi:MAG: hypothetical protein AAF211_34085, partial [Myxococcota bacterium]
MRRAEQLDWIAAGAADTASAYRAYLGAHPQGVHAPQAREKAASLLLAAAELEGTPEALTTFLVEFPDDPRKAEIEDRIEGLWHEQAVREGTDEAWGRYLVRYPSGRWAGDARTARDEAAWARAVTEDTRSAYERYVNRFDNGLHRLDALDWLARLRVSRIQPVLALGKAPGTPEQRRELTYELRKTLDASLGRELKRDFEVMRTIMVDLQGGAPPHPQDAYGAAADTGLLVVVYNEKRGAELEPSGFATAIGARRGQDRGVDRVAVDPVFVEVADVVVARAREVFGDHTRAEAIAEQSVDVVPEGRLGARLTTGIDAVIARRLGDQGPQHRKRRQ